MKVNIIGIGGVGSHIVEPIARLLSTAPDGPHLLVLLDGDKIENKNLVRQAFSEDSVGVAKAESAAHEAIRKFGVHKDLSIGFDTVYLNEKNVGEYIESGDWVILCVDNHPTRRLVSKHCETLDTSYLFSAGNNVVMNGVEYPSMGNAQTFIRVKGKNLTAPLTENHPEIENPEGGEPHPDDKSCDQILAEGGDEVPQTLAANFFAANLLVTGFSTLFMWARGITVPNKLIQETRFDTLNGASEAILYRDAKGVEIV